MSSGKRRAAGEEARFGKLTKLEDRLVEIKDEKKKAETELREYKVAVIKKVCEEIVNGNVKWIPHLYEQVFYGMFDISQDAYEIQKPYLDRLSIDGVKNQKQRERMYIVIDILGYPRWDGEGNWAQNSMHNTALRGAIAKSEIERRYWEFKLKLERGEIDDYYYPGPLSDRPDLSRRWDLFCVYEAEMNRRAAASLLLCARVKCTDCPFFKDLFPLDLLKVIFVFAELAWSEDEKKKLRARSYYNLMEK